jgi:hypothetical protein
MILFRFFCLLCKNFNFRIYRTIILPVVLYGYETWSLSLSLSPLLSHTHTQKEEHRLRVFENRVLRRIFGHKEEVVGD